MFNYPGSPDPKLWAAKADLDKAFASMRVIEAKQNALADLTMSLTVTLGSNGGTGTTASVSLKGFEQKALPECDATKTGQWVKTWNTAADGSGTSYGVGDRVDYRDFSSDTLALYAQWTNAHYSIEYSLNGGVNGTGNPSEYVYGTGISHFANASKEGFTFTGWTDAGGDPVTSIANNATGDVVLYAQFAPAG